MHVVFRVQAMIPRCFARFEGGMPRLPNAQGWRGYATDFGDGSDLAKHFFWTFNNALILLI